MTSILPITSATVNVNGGMHNKITEINNLINKQNIDILVIVETRMPPQTYVKIKNLFKNYSPICCKAFQSKNRKGWKWGIMVLVKNHIHAAITKTRIWDNKRMISFNINLNKLNISQDFHSKKISLYCIYAPAKSDKNEKNIFYRTLRNICNTSKYPKIILGDFNIKYVSSDSLMEYNKILQDMEMDIPNHKESFTYFKGNNKTEIDYILYSRELIKYTKNYNIMDINLVISPDHKIVISKMELPALIDMEFQIPEETIKTKINKRNYTKDKMHEYQSLLSKKPINEDEDNNISTINKNIMNKIEDVSKQVFGIDNNNKKFKVKNLSKELNIMQINLKRLIKARLALKTLKVNTNTPKWLNKVNKNISQWRVEWNKTMITSVTDIEDIVNEVKLKLKKARNEWITMLEKFNKEKIKKAIEKCVNKHKVSPKTFFRNFSVKKADNIQNQLGIIREENLLYSKPEDVINLTHKFFQKTFDSQTISMKQQNEWYDTNHMRDIKNKLQNTSKDIMKEITIEELNDEMMNMPNKKAVPDLLDNECIKNIDESTKKEILKLFNKILFEKEIPEE